MQQQFETIIALKKQNRRKSEKKINENVKEFYNKNIDKYKIKKKNKKTGKTEKVHITFLTITAVKLILVFLFS